MFNFTKCLSAHKLVFRSNKCRRNLSSSKPLHIKIALCGASGGVGQPLALLLKMSPLVSELVTYDIANVNGVAADLSHINTKVQITSYDDPNCLEDAVSNKDIIVVAAGKPRQPGMSKADIFDTNAQIIKEISVAVSRMAPKALFAIITNPLNSIVPIAAEVFKKANVFDSRKIFGITTLDVVRASTFSAKILCLDPTKVNVPVIGGHTGIAVVPLLSQAKPTIELPKDKLKALSERIQNAGSEIITVKAGKGSATLSAAYAAARFIFALCRGIRGENDIVECAYVASDLTDAAYFATPLLLGPEGIKKNLGFGKLDNFECNLLNAALPEIIKDIKKGVDFIKEC